MKGRQRPFPIYIDHIESVEGIVGGSMRSESGQLESLASADAPCVLVDRLNDVFGRIMVASLVSHFTVGRDLSRNVAFALVCFAVLSVRSSLLTAPSATQGVACASQVDSRHPEQLILWA